MSPFGISRGIVLASPTASNACVATGAPAKSLEQRWRKIATAAAIDWITVLVGMLLSCLAIQHLLIVDALRRPTATLVESSLCVATLVISLLINEGAYREVSGLSQITAARHPVHVGTQASLLIFLVQIMEGGTLSLTTIEFSLFAAILLLIVEKQMLLLLVVIWGDEATKTRPNETTASTHRGYETRKRIADLSLGTAAFIATSPVWVFVPIFIWMDSPGRAIFVQERVGKDGRTFRILKFRTMHNDAPQYAPSPESPTDPRLTRVGRILRKCSLDELPQLVNVIKGDMSLVGPRPEMPNLVKEHPAEHMERLWVLPGMTGLWQLSPARAARIHDNPHYDRYYVRHRSLSMDLAILLLTPIRLLRGV